MICYLKKKISDEIQNIKAKVQPPEQLIFAGKQKQSRFQCMHRYYKQTPPV